MRAFIWPYGILFPNARTTSEGNEHCWTKRGKIIDAGRLIFYVSNSGVTELDLTKLEMRGKA